jgi:hypothetical protein
MMLTASSAQMFDLQEFLSKVDPSDTRSKRGTIHEVEENDPDHLFMKEQAAEYRASQQSISRHSKSSNSLHSANSASSINRGGNGSGSPVISNPAAVSANSNFNNSKSAAANDQRLVRNSASGERLDLQELLSSVEAMQSERQDMDVAPRHRAVSAGGGDVPKLSPGQQRHGHRHNPTYVHKSKVISKRSFHKSSGSVREEEGKRAADSGKTTDKKIHRSSTDLSAVKGDSSVGPLGLDLSDFAELTWTSEEMIGTKTPVNPPRLSREDLREQPQLSTPTPPTKRGAGSSSMTETPQQSEIEQPQTSSNPVSQHSSQDSGDLLSWEDFLVSTSPTHQGPQAAPPTLSEGSGDDSIWLEYGSV